MAFPRSPIAKDDAGVAAVYVAIVAAALIGAAGLAIDGGRLMSMHSQLQAAADAFALAGAAELDRHPDAITRAQRAISTLVTNRQTVDAGGSDVTVASVRFLSTLPATDSVAIGGANVTTNPALARFVEIQVETRTMGNLFIQAVGAGNSSATASAVAGFDAGVCGTPPLFICNPFAGSGMTVVEALEDPAIRRRQLKATGLGGSSWFGGGFGFLESPTGPGASALADSMAVVGPASCYRSNAVDVKPGATAAVRDAVNVRFDLYRASYGSVKSDSNYRPSLNVTKGYTGPACNPSPDAAALGMPRDTCMSTGTCPYLGGRMGDGTWDFDGYWSVNHSGLTKPNGWSNASLPSRYDVYRWEIGANYIPDNSPAGEDGNPRCYSGGGLSDTPDRRVLYGAVIDCSGLSGAATDVPVDTFVKLFLTEPMTAPPNEAMYVEFIGVVEPGTDDEVVSDVIQLYR